MNQVEKKVELYRQIADLIGEPDFNEAAAAKVVQFHGEIKGEDLLLSELTVELLRESNRAIYDYDDKLWDGFNRLVQLVEIAFADLARNLRMPAAQRVFAKLRQLIDPELCDLFVRVVNIRRLSEDRSGASVITLVVDNHEKFQRYLWDRNAVEQVHSLEGKGPNEE